MNTVTYLMCLCNSLVRRLKRKKTF